MAPIQATPSAQYLKTNNIQNINNNKNANKTKGNDKKSNPKSNRSRLESESSSDVDNHKNAMMFEMDM